MDGKGTGENPILSQIWLEIKDKLSTGKLSPNDAFGVLREELRKEFEQFKVNPQERFHLAVATTLLVQRAIMAWSKPYNEHLNSMVDALNGDGWNCRAISFLTTLVVTELGFEGISSVDVLELYDGRVLTTESEDAKHEANLVRQGAFLATPDQGYMVNHRKIMVIEGDHWKAFPLNEMPQGAEGLTLPRIHTYLNVMRSSVEWMTSQAGMIDEKNIDRLQQFLDKGRFLL